MSPRKLSRKARQNRLRATRKLAHLRLINSYFDKARESTGSDRQTAARIGISPQKVSDIRHGRRPLSLFAAVRLARLLKLNTNQELANALSRMARSTKTRIFWLDFASGIWPATLDIYDKWAKSPKSVKYPC